MKQNKKEELIFNLLNCFLFFAFCLIFVLPSQALEINDILVRAGTEGEEIFVQCDGAIKGYKDFSLRDPSRIVLDMEEVSLNPSFESNGSFSVRRGQVLSIDVSQFKQSGKVARVVVGLKNSVPYSVIATDNQIVLSLKTNKESFIEWKATSNFSKSVDIGKSKPIVVTETSAEVGREGVFSGRGGRPVSMDLENADILTVLRAMAEYSGRDIVVSSEVKGNVTVRLHNVPWRTALNQILKAAGLGATEEGGVIRVSSLATLKQELDAREQGEPLVTRVYKLEYLVASEAKTPVKNTLSARGKMEADDRSNTIVVTDIASNHDKVAELFRILDTTTPQVEIMAKIVEVNIDAARALGITWSLTGIQSYNYNYNIEPSVTAPPTEVAIGSLKIGTVRDWMKLTATLEALERESKANVISAPRVSAVNNKRATMFGGKKVPVAVRDQSGNLVAQYIEAGVKLEVTPFINSLEDVTITLIADVSEPDMTTLVLGLPVITTNKADSRMVLKDGETVVLGGLKKSTVKRSLRGVPILMSIPVLGNLFRSTTNTIEERELLIFVTPHIIRPQ